MKSIVVFTQDPWMDKLHGASILELFKEIAKCGYIVKIILPSDAELSTAEGTLLVTTIKKTFITSISGGITSFTTVWKTLLKLRPSLIIFDYPTLPLFIIVKLLFNTDGALLILSRPVGQRGLISSISFLKFRLSLLFAKKVVKKISAISPFEAAAYSSIAKINKEKMMILPSPLGIGFKKIKDSNLPTIRKNLGLSVLIGKKVLLYHGVLNKSRKIMEVVSLFYSCFKINSDTFLLIIGNGPEKTNIQNYILQHKINNILLLGSVPYSRMPDYVNASDIGIVMLPNTSDWRFQCPTKLNEFLALEKPVIASDLPGIRWIANDNSLVHYIGEWNCTTFKKAYDEALSSRRDENTPYHKKSIEQFSTYSIAKKIIHDLLE